jgi:sugar lactone lactonase YvrE
MALLLLMSAPAFAQAPPPQPPFFTPGNLVVAVSGCGVYGGTCTNVPYGTGQGGSYGDDQGAPWTLFQYIPNGTSSVTFVNPLQLPQNISGANYPVSNDYGSQSEGTVQLSGNGAYLTMMGYGLNAATFNGNYLTYCPGSTMLSNACVPENGNPAMAQTGSLLGQTYSGNTAVPRVTALIDANGNVNSSTVLYNIFNQNDARSAYTPDGANIYLSGQGCKTWDAATGLCSGGSYDDTSGVYLTTLGANNYLGSNNPTAITGPDNGPTGCTSLTTCTSSEDTRTVQIHNNTLYVSMDAKPGGTGYNRSYIGTLGDPPATSQFTCTGVGAGCGTGYGPYGPAEMPGFGNTGGTGKYTINTAGSGNNSNGNSLNAGLAVNLSPQNFFFASPTVLYVADTGSPKNDSNGPDTVCTTDGGSSSKATVGDGGLQKWILNPTVTAGVTKNSTTVTAPSSGAFTQGQVGLPISDSAGDIPAGTTITAVSTAGKTATMSANATATDATDSITVSGWSLVYTLYNGLNLVLNTDCDPSSPTTQGSLSATGLYGLAGAVNNGVATLYVTNYPNNDLVQTYLYGITDTLATTTMTSPGTAFTLLDTAPANSVFRGVSFVPTIQNGDVEITSVASGVPSGLTVTTSGTGCAPSTFTTPLTLAWTPGSPCQLSVVSPQSPTTGTQYVFSQWQDGTTGTTDTVTAPSSTATNTYTYTATFTTQYLLTTAAGTGGSVSAGGYINSGANATITATPAAGYYFVNFTGTATSTSNPFMLPMTGPQSITANFTAKPVSFTSGQTNFGSVNVCPGGQTAPAPCSASQALSYGIGGSLTFGSAATVLTEGSPSAGANGDFSVSGSTCTGSQIDGGSCTVNVTFAPEAPGLRTGAVQLTDSSGNLLASVLLQGIGQAPAMAFGPGAQVTLASGLNNPGGVAIDGAGDVFIANGAAVIKLSAGGGAPTAVVGGLANAKGVAVDGAGDLFAGDYGHNRVLEVPAGGGAQVTVGSGLSGPRGVTVDGAGDVFIADSGNNRVVEVPAGGGAQVTVGSGLSNPTGVAVDAAGDVFIADTNNNRVVEVLAGGGGQITVGSGLNGPWGVTVDAAGNVFIADTNNSRVVEVPADGSAQTTVGTGLVSPELLAVDAVGDVFIPDNGNSRVVQVHRSQPPAFTFATTIMGNTSTDSPQSLTVQNIGNQYLNAVGDGLDIGDGFEQVAGSGTPADCTTSFSLAPGASCNVSISFTPVSNGNTQTTATFFDNALNATAASQSVALQGATPGLPRPKK